MYAGGGGGGGGGGRGGRSYMYTCFAVVCTIASVNCCG